MSLPATKSKRQTRTRSGSGGPTVADVARLAGVSPMTVSRVVNKDPSVRAETAGKVQQAISAIGYVPNNAARKLAGGRHCRIALLHSNPSSAYLTALLMGCLEGVSAFNGELIVEKVGGEFNPIELLSNLRAHRIDAVILPPPLCDHDALLLALRDAHVPMAQIATGNPAAFAYSVAIDDKAAMRKITQHLIELGHSRIGFVTGDANQSVSALRQKGYEAALDEAGLARDADLIVKGDFTYRSGLTAAETLIKLAQRPSAILASNDDMAAAVIAVAHKHRLSVPEELSVCGFDDSAMATTIWPEVTTIRQPISEMAQHAANLLAKALASNGNTACEESPDNILFDFELIERGSAGLPLGLGE